MGLDGQLGADEIALGAQVMVRPVRNIATRGAAERVVAAHVEVLVLDAEEHVDQRTLVHHEVEATAGIPAGSTLGAVLSGHRRAANAGDSVAIRALEISRSITAAGIDHPTIPGIAQLPTCGEQVGDLVLAEGIGGDAGGQKAAMAAALTEASAQGCLGAQNPGAPLPLRTSMEAVDAVAVVGGEAVKSAGGYGTQTASRTETGRERRMELTIDIVPHATGVEADIGTGPIVVHYGRRRCRNPHVRRHCRPCEHRRKRHASKQELLHSKPPRFPVAPVESSRLVGSP